MTQDKKDTTSDRIYPIKNPIHISMKDREYLVNIWFWWSKLKNAKYIECKQWKLKWIIAHLEYEDWNEEYRNLYINWSYISKYLWLHLWYETIEYYDVYICDPIHWEINIIKYIWDIIRIRKEEQKSFKEIRIISSECNIPYNKKWRTRFI